MDWGCISRSPQKRDMRNSMTRVDVCYGMKASAQMAQMMLHLMNVSLFVGAGSKDTQQCSCCCMDVMPIHK
jgi:hypothetical protein